METTDTTSGSTDSFQFTGKSMEYFKIWIVNIVLSILTLGIYSPWAKVRNKRYFYGNTIMDGSTFEYLADPLSILKGRIIVFAVILVYYLCVSFVPVTELFFLIVFILAIPWLIVKSLQFNARNSAFRNVRFNFESSVGKAAITFILLPLVTLITLGLATPYFIQKMNKYIITNSSFGTTTFDMDATVKSFYIIYLKAFGMLMLLGVSFSVVMPMLMPTPDPNALQQTLQQVPGQAQPLPATPDMMAGVAGIAALVGIMMFYMFIGVYIQTATFNLVFNNTKLGSNKLGSNLKTGKMFYIALTNMLLVIFSVGLLIPMAKIRLARYRINQMNLATQGTLNEFINHEQTNIKATGEEFAEAFDIDIGF